MAGSGSDAPFDVAVFGGGPAGAACAIKLATRGLTVALYEPRPGQPKIGELLAPAAKPALDALGISPEDLSADHRICSGIDSLWAGPDINRLEFFRSPYGYGWFLDRRVFEGLLLELARQAGVRVEGDAFASGAVVEDDTVCLPLQSGRMCHARFVVDATGRTARLARDFGTGFQSCDTLVAFSRHVAPQGENSTQATPLLIEAVEAGWWYTAPVPDGRRVFVFLTDADLPVAHLAAKPSGFETLLLQSRTMRRMAEICEVNWSDANVQGWRAATRWLEAPAGTRWLAIGDAAVARDPLSGGGMRHALSDGQFAAETIDAHLAGDPGALARYVSRISENRQADAHERCRLYSQQKHWPWSPFWARRSGQTI